MTDKSKANNKGALAGKPGYEVGYGKPPKSTQFQKGKSGNPRGRPKGSKNKMPELNEERMKEIILEEAYRSITIRDGTRNVRVPIVKAVMRSLAVNAVKGQHHSQRLFSELLASVESNNRMLSDDNVQTAINYKIEWERELDDRERLGITHLPEPIPHPDHVVVDIREGTVRIMGPATQQEKDEFDLLRKHRGDVQEELEWLEKEIRDPNTECSNSDLEQDIEQTRQLLERFNRVLSVIPEPGSTRLLGKGG